LAAPRRIARSPSGRQSATANGFEYLDISQSVFNRSLLQLGPQTDRWLGR
jgi:hypothetical protein